VDDDVTVVRDEYEQYTDGTVARVRVLQVPQSPTFEHGIKYAFHYDDAVADETIIRFDNHHGVHELHLGETTYEIDFPGLAALYRAWRAGLPEDRRTDW
jgi:hypothetical protein